MRADLAEGWAELARVWPVTVSDWWEAWAEEWGRRRLEVVRVGRRGGKSTMLARLAVLEAVFGQHAVPAGDCGVVAVVSCDRRSRDLQAA